MVKGSFNVVIGAQAGSEAKGKLSAYLVGKFKPEVLTMASSPNAGHTVVVGDRKLVTYHLPAGLAKANYGVTVVLVAKLARQPANQATRGLLSRLLELLYFARP